MATHTTSTPKDKAVQLNQNQNGFPAPSIPNNLGPEMIPGNASNAVPRFDPTNPAIPKYDLGNAETVGRWAGVKVKTSPPPSSEIDADATNKRRRRLPTTNIEGNKGKAFDAEVTEGRGGAGTKDDREIEVPTEETPYGKEIEMKDAEAAEENQNDEELEAGVQASKGHKQVEMPYAPRVLEQKHDGEKSREDASNASKEHGSAGKDKTHEDKASDGEVKPDADQNTKQDRVVKERGRAHSDPTEDDRIGSQESVNVEERVALETGGESGEQVLSEVASLLKEVQETDNKAKLEVEVKVKVKKMDGMVKENRAINQTSDVGHENEGREGKNAVVRHHQPAPRASQS